MIRINVLFIIYNYNCFSVVFIKNNILSYETDNAIMSRDKYTVLNMKKNRYPSFMFKKQNLFHVPFYYILDSLFFSIETVNGIHNMESNHDKLLHFVSYFAICQQSPMKSLCSKRFFIIPLFRSRIHFSV